MNVMLDLETTGTTAGCCILSLAVVPFGLDTPVDSFYERISHISSMDAGFTNDPETLRWWDRQKPDVQEEAFGGTREVKAVLESFIFYMQTLGEAKDMHVWGNGKDFDNVILAAALKKLGLKQPWDFRNNWCYRDMAKLYKIFEKPAPEIPHHALYDAKAQAAHLEIIARGARRGIPPIFPD